MMQFAKKCKITYQRPQKDLTKKAKRLPKKAKRFSIESKTNLPKTAK